MKKPNLSIRNSEEPGKADRVLAVRLAKCNPIYQICRKICVGLRFANQTYRTNDYSITCQDAHRRYWLGVACILVLLSQLSLIANQIPYCLIEQSCHGNHFRYT